MPRRSTSRVIGVRADSFESEELRNLTLQVARVCRETDTQIALLRSTIAAAVPLRNALREQTIVACETLNECRRQTMRSINESQDAIANSAE